MVFLFNLFFSVIYCDVISRFRYKLYRYNNLVLFTPILIVWTFICGSQYYVGTDYPTYIQLFSGENLEYYAKGGEIGFSIFIEKFNQIGFKGQSLYYILYFISFVLLFKILEVIDIKYWGAFILLYIVVSTMFNNQLNIVRQSFAIYLGTYAAIKFHGGRTLVAVLLILLATSFHISTILFFVFFLCKNYLSRLMSISKLVGVLLIGLFGSFVLSTSFLEGLKDYVPAYYVGHLTTEDSIGVGILNRVTKLIYLPLYILSILYVKKINLRGIGIWLFNWGIIGLSVRLLLMNIPVINRVSFIFLLISLFPLLYYIEYLRKERNNLLLYCIYLGLFLFYSIKVLILPANEYAYDSTIFHLI